MSTTAVAERRQRQNWLLSLPGNPKLWTLGICISLWIIGAIVTYFRISTNLHDIVWAEDGNIFLDEALKNGPLNVLFEGYAGYQHFIPRVVTAAIISTLPLQAYAIAIYVVCCALTGAIAAGVYLLAANVVPWPPARIALASITFLIPLSSYEIIGNLADIHTLCFWLAIWLMFARPRNLPAGIGWGCAMLACALTEVQTLILLPVIFFRLRRPDRTAWPIFAGLVLGSIAQIITLLTVQREAGSAWLGIPALGKSWLLSSVLPLFTADPNTQHALIEASGAWIPLLIAVLIYAIAAFAIIFGSGLQRLLAIGLAASSPLLYAASLTLNGAFFLQDLPHLLSSALNLRYGVIPGMLLAAVIPLAASILVRRLPGMTSQILGLCAIATMLIVFIAADFRSGTLRGSADTWSPAVKAAIEECQKGEATGDGKPPSQELPVAPHRIVRVSCEALTK